MHDPLVMRGLGAVMIVLSLALTQSSCTRERDRSVGEATVTSAGIATTDDAIERLVRARCTRETACSRAAPERVVTTPEVCERNLRAALAVELDPATACPLGVDAAKLSSCLSAVENEDCANPAETISRLLACRESELCPRVERYPAMRPR
jgi:hypothetical protein